MCVEVWPPHKHSAPTQLQSAKKTTFESKGTKRARRSRWGVWCEQLVVSACGMLKTDVSERETHQCVRVTPAVLCGEQWAASALKWLVFGAVVRKGQVGFLLYLLSPSSAREREIISWWFHWLSSRRHLHISLWPLVIQSVPSVSPVWSPTFVLFHFIEPLTRKSLEIQIYGKKGPDQDSTPVEVHGCKVLQLNFITLRSIIRFLQCIHRYSFLLMFSTQDSKTCWGHLSFCKTPDSDPLRHRYIYT